MNSLMNKKPVSTTLEETQSYPQDDLAVDVGNTVKTNIMVDRVSWKISEIRSTVLREVDSRQPTLLKSI